MSKFIDVLEDQDARPTSFRSMGDRESFVDVLSDEYDPTKVPQVPQTKPAEVFPWEAFDQERLSIPIPKPTGGIDKISVDEGIRALGGLGPQTSYEAPTPVEEPRPPGIYQGAESDFASIPGAIKKSTQAFLTEAAMGLPKLTPGYEEEEAYGIEKIPVGISSAAGFLVGAPGQVIRGVTKGVSKFVPWTQLIGNEGVIARTMKSMAKEAPALSAGTTAAAAGDALNQKDFDSAFNVLKDAAKSGAIMGTTFAGTRGVYWREAKDRIKRMGFGMALLDLQRGATPFDDRDLVEKIRDYSIDSFFLWGGLPDAFKGLENEIKIRTKEEGLDKKIEKEIKKVEVLKEEDAKRNPYYNSSLELVKKEAKLEEPFAVQELRRRELEKEELDEDVPDSVLDVKVKKVEEGKRTKDGKYLKATRKLKKKLGDEKYYEILQKIGLEKSNQVMNKGDKAKVLKALESGLEIEEPIVEEVSIEKINEIASKLEVTYDGIQEGFKTIPDKYQFTDKKTGSTFYATKGKDLETEISKSVEEMREKFKIEEPIVEPEIKEEIEPDEGTKVAEEAEAAEKEAFDRELAELPKAETEPIEEPKSITIRGNDYPIDLSGNIVKESGKPFENRFAATAIKKRAEKEGKRLEVVENKDGKFVLREVIEEETIESPVVEEPTYEEKIPIEEPKPSIENPDEFRRDIAHRLQRFRKGEDLSLEDIEEDMESLSLSREESDFDELWEYEQFNDLNDTVLDLVRKVREESEGIPEELDFDKDVTLDSLGFQQLWDTIANRLSAEKSRQLKLTKLAIKKRDKKSINATEVDLDDINRLGKFRGLDSDETLKIAKNLFGYRTKLSKLSQTEADILKAKLVQMEPREVMENEKIIYDNPNIKDSTKKALKRSAKIYDVDDVELGDYLSIWQKEGKDLTNHDVNMVISTIRAVNEIRPDQGRVIWAYLAPAKRLFGEKFMEPIRAAEVKKLDNLIPNAKKVRDLNRDLNIKSREAVWEYLNGTLEEKSLSPQELEVAKGARGLFNEWFDLFEVPGYNPSYAPHLSKYSSREDIVDWAFSINGMKDFDFWAEHKRTGEIDVLEKDLEKVMMSYLRAGLAKKFYQPALDAVKPIIDKMSPERRSLANKWLDTVVKKKPTADEIVGNRLIENMFKAAGLKVDKSARYYRQLVGTVLDMNYSAYMGLRPKLALRNMTQQFLIMNEYGYGSWLRGRTGKYKPEVKAAMEKSDVYKLRKKQYLVMEEEITRVSDLPAEARQKMMWFYRKADIDNVEVAFATGFLNARKLHPKLPLSFAIRAGEKAIHNTQWGYGIDLPYMFKTPTGKFLGQYMSWPIWYADHMSRIVKERHGAKLARTVAQAAIIGMLLENFDVDYTRTVLFGTMPDSLGYGVSSVINIMSLLKSLGSFDSGKIEQAGEKVYKDVILGLLPGYLASKDFNKFMEGHPEEFFLYKKRRKSSKEGGIGTLGSI